MAINFNPATKISVSGPLSISDKRSADMPLDIRGRIETLTDITTIPFAWEGMLVYVKDTKKYYKVTSLANRTVGGVTIPYYPATWVEFGSGGSTPSPTPSEIDAGNVSYFSSGTFSNNTVGKELQSLASEILSLAEDIHNINGDIGTLSNLNTEDKQDLVSAINEVLSSTGSTISVIDNLVSNSTTNALSAHQGKVLKGLVDGKVAGIKLQGESEALPMNNGIVTIPAGDITGATVGGNPVTESSGVLQFDAYPTANTMQYSNSTNYSSGTIGKEVKDLNISVNDLSVQVAELDKPSPAPSQSTTVVNLANYTTSNSSFTYDVDNKYVYNTKDTAFYQYSEEDNSNTVYYGVFKVIGEDRYLMYSITNNTTFTYVNTYTESTLPENAKKEFALGSVAVVKRVNGEGESWKNGTVNLFCTKQNMALRNRCKNINFNGSTAWRVLIKSEDGNTIFVYKAKSNGNYEWEINVPRSSATNFNLLDKYFDRPEASGVSFDDTITQLGTQEDPITDVQAAINQLAAGVNGLTGKLKICLKYANSSPVVDKEVSITVNYRGSAYDISSQYSPDTEGFKTDNNGYVINANSNEYIVLPLGAVYTIHLYDISDSYLTPEDVTDIIDTNTENVNFIYQNAVDVEFAYYYVQMPNVSPSVVNVENKIINVDFYSDPYTHALAYKCVLRANGTVKQILNADGTQASYNGEDLISASDAVLLPVPIGTKYLSSLQLWDTTISENQQRYIKSPDVIYTSNKNKRTIKFTYYDNQVGIFLVVSDSSTTKGYRECLVTDIDNQNNIITFKDGDYTYEAYQDNSTLYRKLTNDVVGEQWEETILGYGIRTSTTIYQPNDDTYTNSEYPNCSFMLPKTPTIKQGQLYSAAGEINVTVNYGGLFVSRIYNELSGAGTSPIINDLLNNNALALTLTTSGGGTKIIKAFGVTLNQFRVIVGVMSQIRSISTMLFSIDYNYRTTTVANVQPITLVVNNGISPSNTGSEVPNFIADTLATNNPRARSISSVDLHVIIAYPF